MHEYTQLRMVSAYAKGSEAPFETEKPYNWREDAACAFQPHTLFEIASSNDPIAEGIVPEGSDPQNELTALNANNFKRAQEICNTCPVWHECYTNAALDDFQWTVRAGILPTKFNSNLQGRPKTAALKKVSLIHGATPGGKYCSKGHCNWYNKPNGERVCRTCKQDKDVERRPRVGVKVDPSKPCDKCGTKNWRSRVGQGGHICRTCKANKAKETRWLKSGISLESSQPCASGHMDWKPGKAYGENAIVFFCQPCKVQRGTISA